MPDGRRSRKKRDKTPKVWSSGTRRVGEKCGKIGEEGGRGRALKHHHPEGDLKSKVTVAAGEPARAEHAPPTGLDLSPWESLPRGPLSAAPGAHAPHFTSAARPCLCSVLTSKPVT